MIHLIAAVVIDWLIGDPESFPHPVKLMGNVIAFEEKLIRRSANTGRHLFWGGLVIVVVNIAMAFFVPYYMLKLLKPYTYLYHAVNIYLLYTCIAARCLHSEAVKVHRALKDSIEQARYRLSFIVGRETGELTEEEIIAADVETVAENTSDGVIAPILFAVIGGAPLAMVYKMVNTMDSMLGYITEKYKYIGYFPAKTDDILNFFPARLTGLLMNISSIFRFDIIHGFKIMRRDRKKHKSPNCAYPEGAVAGLLGIQLGGDHMYHGELVRKPFIGDKKRRIERHDILRTIEIMYRAEVLLMVLYIIFSWRW